METPLYSFNGTTDGAYPAGNLIFDAAGNLYGAASYLGPSGLGAAFELSPTASGPWTFTALHNFTGAPDGADPQGSLVFDGMGNLYGTTYMGGDAGGLGSGTVFELSPSSGGWTENILFNFGDDTTGGCPLDSVIFGGVGNLYGTSSCGGPSKHEYGLVFELSPGSGTTWTETILHDFSATDGDGQYPYGGLVFDAAGNLYGTTNFGGSAKDGSIFKITP